MFKKIRKGKKVLIRSIKFRCNKCNTLYELSDETFNHNMDIMYGASSSSGTLICSNCNSTDFTVLPSFEWKYRTRCQKCYNMFETSYSWVSKCDKCEKEYILMISELGTK